MALKTESGFFGRMIMFLSFAALGLGELKIVPVTSSWTMLGAVVLSIACYVLSGAARAEAVLCTERDVPATQSEKKEGEDEP